MTIPRRVLILGQLGSPANPTPKDIKAYLKEFLGDARVIDLPPLPKSMLLHGVILPRRPKRIAPKYQEIWMEGGSPLVVHSKALAAELQSLLGPEIRVELAMRYGQPSLQELLRRLQQEQLEEIMLLPLFPQQASATTGSMIQQLMEEMAHWRVFPKLTILPEFYSHPGFIQAWVERGRSYVEKGFDKVLFSFHGLPMSQIHRADPKQHCLGRGACCEPLVRENCHCYRAQCLETARLIAKGLGIDGQDYEVTFQSRMGRAEWIGPATDRRIVDLAQSGIKKLLVFSPAFVADCLETLEELAIGEQNRFIDHGGEELVMVPSLNGDPKFAQALAEMVQK